MRTNGTGTGPADPAGPAGAAGPAGPAGPAGSTGPAGATEPAAPAGRTGPAEAPDPVGPADNRPADNPADGHPADRRPTVVRVLTAALTRRAWKELLFAAIGLPLGFAGFAVLLPLLVAVPLSITLVGLPLVALVLFTARGAGALHRALARRLIGLQVTPPRFRPESGPLGWLAVLWSPASWRAVAYLVLKIPVGFLTFATAVGFWLYGAMFASYPLWWWLLKPVNYDRFGRERWSGLQFGDFYLDTWPRAFGLALVGLVLLVVAPWAVRAALGLERLLIRGLLGSTTLTRRVQDLEHTRAHAVDDSAAALRRIERDLHDGAQARLVALAMNLGMAKETLAGDQPPADLDRTRRLVDTAHRTAKEALVELRDLARGIHPPVLDNGLDAALATLAARSAVPVQLRVDVPDRPAPAIETIAYFCVAELLTNVAKHSGASGARVTVTESSGVLWVAVADDGRGGARVDGVVGASGLAGLAERVRTVDGRLEVSSPRGGPTEVTVVLPMRT